MAYKNKIITNPKTGQTIKFLQTAGDTGGRLLEMESSLRGHSTEPPLHYHPYQEETFLVLNGQLTVRLNGRQKIYSAGDQFHVPKNTAHSMWNEAETPAVINWRISPALETEYFFENTFGLSNHGKTNDKGMPGLLQIALIANKYDNIFRLSKPPFFLQKIVFFVLTPVAYLSGYRSSYEKYLK
jgi:quercetin dioxygenase-like cupin family protein